MTDIDLNTPADVDRLRALVTEIDTLLSGPSLFAANDAYGNPGNVAAGELIESAWGNAVVARVVKAAPASARPATAVAGTRFFATDTRRLSMYDGTGWIVMYEPAQTWVPDWANVTEGPSPNSGFYARSNGWVSFSATITIAAGAVIPGQPGIVLPFVAFGSIDQYGLLCVMGSGAGPSFPVSVGGGTSNVGAFYAQRASGTYVDTVPASTSIPFTFVIGSSIIVGGRYRLNDPYA